MARSEKLNDNNNIINNNLLILSNRVFAGKEEVIEESLSASLDDSFCMTTQALSDQDGGEKSKEAGAGADPDEGSSDTGAVCGDDSPVKKKKKGGMKAPLPDSDGDEGADSSEGKEADEDDEDIDGVEEIIDDEPEDGKGKKGSGKSAGAAKRKTGKARKRLY